MLPGHTVPHLVKDAQQPGRVGCEGSHAAPGVPDGQGPPHQLVPARRVHWVDAEVSAAKADCALLGEGAGGVVFGHHQAVPAGGELGRGLVGLYATPRCDRCMQGTMTAVTGLRAAGRMMLDIQQSIFLRSRECTLTLSSCESNSSAGPPALIRCQVGNGQLSSFSPGVNGHRAGGS